MKSLVELLELLLLDCGRLSGAPVSRDVETLRARVKHEGDSFITITLPAFCSDFERSLDMGRIAPGAFASFRKLRSGTPAFLQGFLCGVFGSDGTLIAEPSVASIRMVRQICLFGKKVARPCSDARLAAAAEAYSDCDSNVAEALPETSLGEMFGAVADVIIDSFPDIHGLAFVRTLMPKHGPGATQERISGNRKWVFRSWHARLSRVGFTYEQFGAGTRRTTFSYLDEEPAGDILSVGLHAEPCYSDVPPSVDPEHEPAVRVVFVPKTLKTPRVIAVEPVCMQFAQQGLSQSLCRAIERSRISGGHVNFRDQTVNQTQSLQGSRGGLLATLDLSEASDRVSMAHVNRLLASVPVYREWVLAARSARAQLPSGETIVLRKFASMGSALCFPVESLVFFTSIIASRLSRAGVRATSRSVELFSRDVYVYGDDLIVPTDEAPAICDDLEALGFKVNRRKSFWTGQFRESCGFDCYGGEQVTPVYLRRDMPKDRKDTSGILSAVATSRQLSQAGYTGCAAALREAVESLIGFLPVVSTDSPALGWTDYSEYVPPKRWNTHLQRREYLCWVATSPKTADPLEGDAALAKCYRVIGNETVDPGHLRVSPVRFGTTLKRRWVPA